jgi:hypothetical protein
MALFATVVVVLALAAFFGWAFVFMYYFWLRKSPVVAGAFGISYVFIALWWIYTYHYYNGLGVDGEWRSWVSNANLFELRCIYPVLLWLAFAIPSPLYVKSEYEALRDRDIRENLLKEKLVPLDFAKEHVINPIVSRVHSVVAAYLEKTPKSEMDRVTLEFEFAYRSCNAEIKTLLASSNVAAARHFVNTMFLPAALSKNLLTEEVYRKFVATTWKSARNAYIKQFKRDLAEDLDTLIAEGLYLEDYGNSDFGVPKKWWNTEIAPDTSTQEHLRFGSVL